MADLSISSLAEVLVRKNGLEADDAVRFIDAVFDIIKEGLEEDKIVKVKGLGTFKIIGVDARESVNVNTGERVLINSHSKITFIPDNTMKELVNRPFSQFETVVLNDGVDFNDIDAAVPDETDDIPEPARDPLPQAEEAIPEPSLEKEEDKEEEVQSAESQEIEDETEEERLSNLLRNILCGVSVILLIAGAAYGGYRYGRYEAENEQMRQNVISEAKKSVELSEQKASQSPADTVKGGILDATEIGAMKLDEKKDSSAAGKQPEQTVAKPVLPEQKKKAEKPVPKPETDYSKYEKMDVRVRTGAYRIVGTDRVVKVKEGQTLKRISRNHLGEGMECYIEVYNDIKADDPLKAGTEIKIPKLELKKKK